MGLNDDVPAQIMKIRNGLSDDNAIPIKLTLFKCKETRKETLLSAPFQPNFFSVVAEPPNLILWLEVQYQLSSQWQLQGVFILLVDDIELGSSQELIFETKQFSIQFTDL